MITLYEKVFVNVSYQDSLMTAGKNDYIIGKGVVNISYQDSLRTAGRNDYFIGKGVCKGQLSRQPDDSWQK
jgi:hypothetical protein